MADPETIESGPPTEIEHALATAELFGKVYQELVKQVDLKPDVLLEAAKLATQNTMRHYHYVLEAYEKSQGKTPASELATEKQISWINQLIAQNRLRVSKENYVKLKTNTLSKEDASKILNEFKNVSK